MTSAEFAALRMTVPGVKPFAGDATVAGGGLIVPGAASGAFSMPGGFDATFDAAPTADGSNMVQRGQINFIGKMASYVPFAGKVGFDYWGFDPAVATAQSETQPYGIGGYPEGAVLTLVKDGCYLKVISLVDNNKVDFTGTTDRTVYTDIVNGSVDGVNWQYLSLDPQTLIDQSVMAEIPKTTFTNALNQPLNVFKAATAAALVVDGGLECEVDKPVETESSVTQFVWNVRLVVSAPKDSLADLASWTPGVTPTGGTADTTIYKTGGVQDAEESANLVKTVITTPGKYYGIGLVGKAWAPTGSTIDDWSLRVSIAESTVKVHLKVL